MIDCLVISLYKNTKVQILGSIIVMNFLIERNKFTILYNLVNYLLIRMMNFS